MREFYTYIRRRIQPTHPHQPHNTLDTLMPVSGRRWANVYRLRPPCCVRFPHEREFKWRSRRGRSHKNSRIHQRAVRDCECFVLDRKSPALFQWNIVFYQWSVFTGSKLPGSGFRKGDACTWWWRLRRGMDRRPNQLIVSSDVVRVGDCRRQRSGPGRVARCC